MIEAGGTQLGVFLGPEDGLMLADRVRRAVDIVLEISEDEPETDGPRVSAAEVPTWGTQIDDDVGRPPRAPHGDQSQILPVITSSYGSGAGGPAMPNRCPSP